MPIEYESLDISEPLLPARSRLYHLEPVAFGTGMVESLTSYFSRLAEAHSVTPGVLHHHEVLPRGAGRRNMFSCSLNFRARSFTASLNSAGRVARKFASVLGGLTARTDLDCLTLLPWQRVLPLHLLTRGNAAWCSVCLQSWQSNGGVVYSPLLWAVEVVKYCSEHHCPLQTACPYCDLSQPIVGQCSKLGFCTRCKKWLGSLPDQVTAHVAIAQENPEREIWIANQVKDLIQAGFNAPTLSNKQQLGQIIRAATDVIGLSPLARLLVVSPNSITSWRSGEKLPTLPAYLRMARAFNASLTNLLTAKVLPDSIGSLDLSAVPYWGNVAVRPRSSFDPARAKVQLEQALNESPSPSMMKFKRRTGYHPATLHKHFPDLCEKLIHRARDHQDRRAQIRQQERIAEFRCIAKQLHTEGIELYLNRVLKRMSGPKGLDYRIAQQTLVEVRRELRVSSTHTNSN